MDFSKIFQNEDYKKGIEAAMSLFAAMKIAGDNAAPALAEAFEKRLGYRRCINLKKDSRTPCPTCVATAAELLSDQN